MTRDIRRTQLDRITFWVGRVVAAVVLAGGLSGATAMAASEGFDPGKSGPIVKGSLVADRLTVSSGAPSTIALVQEIPEHWHTYWRNPGDSGAPTRIVWTLPEGVSIGDISWPVPQRIPVGPLMNFGYEGRVVFPMQLTIDPTVAPGTTLKLKADVEWLVCEEICIPELNTFTIALPVTEQPGAASPHAREIEKALADLPQPSPWPVSYSVAEGRIAFAVPGAEFADLAERGALADVELFPGADGVIDYAAPQEVRLGPDGLVLETAAGHKAAELPDRIEGLIVISETMDGTTIRRGFEITAERGTPLPAEALAVLTPLARGGGEAGGPGGASLGLAAAAGFAFLGGIILNLMPCVFPILFIKGLSFLKAGHESAGVLRRGALAYTAGVVVTFLGIAGVLLALRAGGASIGWGFQLQQPSVVLALGLLMFALGLNLSGVYGVSGRLAGFGSGALGQGNGVTASFLTGLLAVIVASPCTAPFMGAAMGYAVAAPAGLGLTVFASLGLGMAAPYLVLAFAPGIAARLPKPGPWMDTLKQVLAFPLYATAAWLVWVYSAQVDTETLFLGLMAFIAVALGAWALGRSGGGRTAGLALRGVAIAALAAAAVLVVLPDRGGPPVRTASAVTEATLNAEPYSFDRLRAVRADGKPVFVNFTAAWCITCLVNERRVLSDPAIAAAFERAGIVYMKGDWTNRDPEITRALEAYGRAGVPLYLFYAPDARRASVLPQILSVDGVIAEIEKVDVAARKDSTIN